MENKEKSNVEERDEQKDASVLDDQDTGVQQKKKKGKGGVLVAICIIFIVGVLAALFVPSFLKSPATTKKAGTDVNTVASTYRLTGNGLEKFDLYFLQLENNSKNTVYSPLSIKYALAMLNEGTGGASHEQIKGIIGDYKPKKYNNNDHMSFANALFIRDTYNDQIKDEYKTTLLNKYNASVILDPFSDASAVNGWVNDKTFGLVNQIIDDSTITDANFVLTNALAIDMNWVNQIHCAEGRPDTVGCIGKGIYSVRYRHEKLKDESEEYSKVSYPYQGDRDFPALTFDGKDNYKSAEVFASFNRYDIIKELGEDKIREEVTKAYNDYLEYIQEANPWEYAEAEKDVNKKVSDFISELKENYGKAANSTDFMLRDTDEVKVFAKDLQEYDGVTLQYVGIMPKNESLEDFIKDEKLSTKVIANIDELKPLTIGAFDEGYVTLIEGKIPMFNYKYDLNLQDDLKKLGVTDVFDVNKSDLSNVLKADKQMISASHSANIEFSNDGIKAGAATAMGGYGSAMGGFNYLFEVPYKKIDITFDKPYMYVIRDKATGEIWFVGTVYEPVQK